jgi:hypothetical protein
MDDYMHGIGSAAAIHRGSFEPVRSGCAHFNALCCIPGVPVVPEVACGTAKPNGIRRTGLTSGPRSNTTESSIISGRWVTTHIGKIGFQVITNTKIKRVLFSKNDPDHGF